MGELEGFKTLLSAADMTKWLENKDQTVLCLENNSLFHSIAPVSLSEQHILLAEYLYLPEGKVLPSLRFYLPCSINFISIQQTQSSGRQMKMFHHYNCAQRES